MARRRTAAGCCSRVSMNEDNARFCLLAGLILLYLLCGAAIFSALEHPSELRARHLWRQQLDNFTQRYRVDLDALQTLLRQYEEANGAGIRVDTLRPRWDFSGAFYFVGTVVSTIGKSETLPFCLLCSDNSTVTSIPQIKSPRYETELNAVIIKGEPFNLGIKLHT